MLDHIAALRDRSRHDVRAYNPRGLRRGLVVDLDAFDALVVHYSLVVSSDHYLSPWFRERIARFDGPKIAYVQDEFRWVDRQTAVMRELGIDLLFTCVPEHSLGALYGDRLAGIETRPTLTGYVPYRLTRLDSPRMAVRPLDVGYRGRELPYWLGRLAYEKREIGERLLDHAGRLGLRVDIAWSEESRLYGTAWSAFLSSCRATLGTESGASIADWDGSVERAVRGYLDEHPGAGFEEVAEAVLHPWEGNAVVNTISPRVFEAAAHRTGLILYRGDYAGIVEPRVHYLPLEKDFSNVADVVAGLRDTRSLEAMVERAHADLIASGRYSEQRLADELDMALDELMGAREPRGGRPLPTRALAWDSELAMAPERARDATLRVLGGPRLAPLRVAVSRARLARTVVAHPDVMRLLVLALRHGGSRRPRELLADAVRLVALREAVGTPALPALGADLDDGTLTLQRRSSSAPWPPGAGPGSVRRLRLDRRSFGKGLTLHRGRRSWTFVPGDDGSYEFTSFARAAEQEPGKAWALAIEPLLGPERRSDG